MLRVVMVIAANIHGSCHCEAVKVSVALSRPPEEIELRACQCSFCRRHGAGTIADPRGRAVIEARDTDSLRTYRFGARTADFLLCAGCGVYIAALIETDEGPRATINAQGLALAPFRGRDPLVADYADESREDRIRRRAAHWMPVELRPGAPTAPARRAPNASA